MLREHDVGLALMYTPHPSLVPIEMASAGMVTVTNSFENKDASALAAISPNLLTVEPSIPAVAAGTAEAVGRAEEHAARVRGSEVVRGASEWGRRASTTIASRPIAAALGQRLGERTTGSSSAHAHERPVEQRVIGGGDAGQVQPGLEVLRLGLRHRLEDPHRPRLMMALRGHPHPGGC